MSDPRDVRIRIRDKKIAELEAEKARALDRLDEMYLARTELEKKQITLLSNYGRLETALRAAEKALEKMVRQYESEHDEAERFRPDWLSKALTAIRAALHGEGK